MCRHIMNENYVHHNKLVVDPEVDGTKRISCIDCLAVWEVPGLYNSLDTWPICPNDGQPITDQK